MKGYTKGDGALGIVNQGITKIIEKDEHEIPNTQTFIPTPSNDEEVRDVLLPATFVNTPKEGTNTSSFTPKSASCNCPRFLAK
jgi:hypothetical protein